MSYRGYTYDIEVRGKCRIAVPKEVYEGQDEEKIAEWIGSLATHHGTKRIIDAEVVITNLEDEL